METKLVTGRVGKMAGTTILVVGLAAGVAIGARRSSTPAAKPASPPLATAPTAAPPPPAAVPPAPTSAKHPPRFLHNANRTELTQTLPKRARIEITASERDAEAFALATEIHAFLRSQGYQADSVIPAGDRPLPPGVGLEPLPDGHWRVIVGAEE